MEHFGVGFTIYRMGSPSDYIRAQGYPSAHSSFPKSRQKSLIALGLRITICPTYSRYAAKGRYSPSIVGWGPIVNNGSEKAIIGIRSHGIGPRFFAKITTGEPKPQPRRKRPTKVNVISISCSDWRRAFSVG